MIEGDAKAHTIVFELECLGVVYDDASLSDLALVSLIRAFVEGYKNVELIAPTEYGFRRYSHLKPSRPASDL